MTCITPAQFDEDFKNHKVTRYAYKGGPNPYYDPEIMIWKSPSSSIYRINYTLVGRTLFVEGDCYEAVYQWSAPVSFEGIANNNLDYFASKCRASSCGVGYKIFDSDTLKKQVEDHIDCTEEEEDELEEGKTGIRQRFEDENWRNHIYHEFEWLRFVDDNYGDLFDESGEGIPDGKRISPECELQLEGIKRAVKQWTELQESEPHQISEPCIKKPEIERNCKICHWKDDEPCKALRNVK
jgi:hypothetical protein